MAKRLTLLLVSLLVLGFVVAGCGDDENDAGNGDTAAETATDANTDTTVEEETATDAETDTDTAADDTDTATEETNTTEDDGGSGGGAAVPRNLQQAAKECRESTGKLPEASEETKELLRKICQGAGNAPNKEAIRETIEDLCEQLRQNAGDAPPEAGEALEQCGRQ
jgi:hypothetical protein